MIGGNCSIAVTTAAVLLKVHPHLLSICISCEPCTPLVHCQLM